MVKSSKSKVEPTTDFLEGIFNRIAGGPGFLVYCNLKESVRVIMPAGKYA